MPRLPALPDLDWTEDGQPRARAYDDVYFSKAGGLAEARAVFLAGCGLPEAWAGRARFAIGELGFGAGLNALAVWDAWRRTRPPGGMLHFTSVEAFPLPREAAARALGAFPEIADLAVRLLAAWPVRAPAPQRLWFPEDGFALTVQIGEACGVLAGMTGAFDAWFLDGFAPARNEAMWRPELFSRVAALSAPGARAATYSVAGGVRRGLEAAGFAVEKRAGFAAKRERLEARLAKPPAAPAPLHPYASRMPARAVIIGGGIAGACLAHAFARRGTAVMLLEAEDLGAGASGAPAALVMPRLERGAAPLGRLHLAAYLEAVRLYESLGAFSAIGVEQGPANARERETFASLAADPPLPEDWLRAQPDGLLHPRAGLVAPAAAIAAMTRAAEIRRGARVRTLERDCSGWIVRDGASEMLAHAGCVVLACGPAIAGFAQTAWLPLRYSRGQLDWAALEGEAPAHARAAGAYAAPFQNQLLFGATFDRAAPEEIPRADAASTARNRAALERLAPEAAAAIDDARMGARAALRVSAPDLGPIAGLAPDAPAWRERFDGLRQGRRLDRSASAPAHDGLYLLGALGARGFTLAPILAERVVSEICGEPQALDADVLDAVHPARFLARALKRGG